MLGGGRVDVAIADLRDELAMAKLVKPGGKMVIYTINKYNLRGKLLASSNNTVLDEFMIGVEDPTSNRSTLGVILSLVLLLSVGLFLVLFYLCRVYSSGDSDHQESNLTSAGYIVEGGSRKVSSWVI